VQSASGNTLNYYFPANTTLAERSFIVALDATNSAGTGSAELTLRQPPGIPPPPPPVCNPTSATYSIPNAGGNYDIIANCTNSPTSYVWSADGQVQTGTSGGILRYYFPANTTPTERAFNISIIASNSTGASAPKHLVFTQRGTNTLRAGDRLMPGQRMYSSDGQFHLLMQTDGNLVVYGPNGVLWDAIGPAGSHVIMQNDGNLVLLSATGSVVWNSQTGRKGATHASLEPNGNLILYTAADKAVWGSHLQPSDLDTIQAGTKLESGVRMLSADGICSLTMHTNGRLVLSSTVRGELWSRGSYGYYAYAVMQHDGNFVVHDSMGRAQWSTETGGNSRGKGATFAFLDSRNNDCDFILYEADEITPVWSRIHGKLR
jgi:hypothetical protein